MAQDKTSTSISFDAAGDAAKTAFAAGGLLAAFGVASCCALPVALSLLGLSAASLLGIGYLAAQYQRELLYAAVICLTAAGLLTWRQRRRRLCVAGISCAHPTLDWAGRIAVLLAIGLLALTFWIEPPV
jgi:mercuric ion transport protein